MPVEKSKEFPNSDPRGLGGKRVGLSEAEAVRRLEHYGPNAAVEVDTPAWRVLLGKFITPVPCLLEVARRFGNC